MPGISKHKVNKKFNTKSLKVPPLTITPNGGKIKQTKNFRTLIKILQRFSFCKNHSTNDSKICWRLYFQRKWRSAPST